MSICLQILGDSLMKDEEDSLLFNILDILTTTARYFEILRDSVAFFSGFSAFYIEDLSEFTLRN